MTSFVIIVDGEVVDKIKAPSLLEAQRMFMKSRGIKVMVGPFRILKEMYFEPGVDARETI